MFAGTRAALRGRRQLSLVLRPKKRPADLPICLFCSLAPAASRARPAVRRGSGSRRLQSTTANARAARAELEGALHDLRKLAPRLVSLPRLQLALQGLAQPTGREAVRVAVLGLSNTSGRATTPRSALKLLLADPLKDAAAWEEVLDEYEPGRPLVVRVGRKEDVNGTSQISQSSPLPEVHISSPELDGADLELLLMDVNLPTANPGDMSMQSTEEALLVPVVDAPSAEDRSTPIVTPVHMSILVTDGLIGAVSLSTLPLLDSGGSILGVVNMPGLSKEQLDASFEIVDLSLAEKGIQLFRAGPQNAMEYEHLWYASNLPVLTNWLRSGIKSPADATKPAVRKLIASLLQSTLATIQAEESRMVSAALRLSTLPAAGALNKGLAQWAQNAHAELRDELDLAFTGRRWRKIGWWKLFWRVDDVAMLTNEMLSQRFLPTAEQELVYLTGRIAEAAGEPQYSQPVSSPPTEGKGSEMRRLGSGELTPLVPATPPSGLPKWPGHIAFTRRYLQNETVPALQALAQRLVAQSLGTTAVTTSLAALLYVSSFASTLYEAGAVVALGVVYSLARMQKKWETARGFWEGEVREEGRKAVRAAEESVAEVIQGGGGASQPSGQAAGELKQARDLVAKAEDALARMK